MTVKVKDWKYRNLRGLKNIDYYVGSNVPHSSKDFPYSSKPPKLEQTLSSAQLTALSESYNRKVYEQISND